MEEMNKSEKKTLDIPPYNILHDSLEFMKG
jgi:hypothetical protein